MGKILFVNLSSGEIDVKEPGEELYLQFLGGYGIGARILYSHQQPGVDPVGPYNMLGFVTGLLTGTPAVTGNRFVVVGKSPLTGTWGDSNSGGYFGPYLKFSGYDAVFFTGASGKPVYLFINDGKAELVDATGIWGKDTHQTEDMIIAAHGKDTKVACIGTAGEKISRISSIITDKGRAAGRSGLGAVMGSKKLKAIAVKGTMLVPLADAEASEQLRRRYLAKMKNSPLAKLLSAQGTSAFTRPSTQNGHAPIKNWGGAAVKDFTNLDAIDGDSMQELLERKYGCWHCPIACGGIMKAGTEYEYAAGVHRPEFETTCNFGTLCLNHDRESIIMANDICNRYGIDTMSTGSTIAFAIECYENGLITKAETDGIELRWGSPQAIIAMTKKLAKREGFGAVLADGVKLAVERIGGAAGKYAMEVGGQELPMSDPKQNPGFGIAYLVDATPGRHTQCGKDEQGTGEEQKKGRTLLQTYNAAGLCQWSVFITGRDPEVITGFLSAVTGHPFTVDELLKTGERIATIRQAFNVREDINLLERKLPDRVNGIPPLMDGPNAGITIDLSNTVKEYLEAMGWDKATGKPSREKLQELGLDDVAQELWPTNN